MPPWGAVRRPFRAAARCLAILPLAAPFLMATLAATAVPAHAQTASFDCRTAETPAEWAVCNTPELGKLDVEMAALYRIMEKAAQARPAFHETLVKSQHAFLADDRARCAGQVACLADAYRQRVGALETLANATLALRP